MPVQFNYADQVLADFPQLSSRALLVDGINAEAVATADIARLNDIADRRLAVANEGDFPEIQAWRRAFAAMGLKPTQYRCASEALLRRFRKDGTLPTLHPLVDLCNATSLAFAIPVAVFDVTKIAGTMVVRYAHGDESYETFAGGIEHPEPGEVIFADDLRRAHARRWTNRQSGWSAVRAQTRQALVVVEALHDDAAESTSRVVDALDTSIGRAWPAATVHELAISSALQQTSGRGSDE
jgi:DNA/RNA-binding domain of Phe-tRNA-synthetase-like protein